MDNGVFCIISRVCSYEIDDTLKMRTSVFFKHMQEVAGRHCDSLGLTYKSMYESGMVFLLSKLYIKIHTSPEYGEDIFEKTWCKGFNRVAFLRDFSFEKEDGEVLAEASSVWVLVNVNNRKIIKPSDFHTCFPITEKSANVPPVNRLAVPDNMPVSAIRRVYDSYTDANKHMNNSIYVDFICDLTVPYTKANRVSDVFVNYRSEVCEGDEVTLRSSALPEGNGYVVAGESCGLSKFEGMVKFHNE